MLPWDSLRRQRQAEVCSLGDFTHLLALTTSLVSCPLSSASAVQRLEPLVLELYGAPAMRLVSFYLGSGA